MKKAGGFSWISLIFKTIATLAMVGTPLLGVWVASSLAAFGNRAVWMPVAAGLLLFPILPICWEGIGELRYRRRRFKKKKFLTFFDRLVLRTLVLNLFFLIGLCASFPEKAFVALAARGDWMLDGHHGPAAEKTRGVLLGAASGLEWLYGASHENPYRDPEDKRAAKQEKQAPKPEPQRAVATTPGDQKYPWPKELHPLVKSIPPEAETSIQALGTYIKDHEPDPFLRVKALHDWVTDRVAYDVPAYLAHAIPQSDGNAEAVFRSHVGVCAGYAKLLEALGKVTGDEIVYVVGDARSRTKPMEGEAHAWNAVKINGGWYLMDATWDAGSLDGDKFAKRYETAYFLTPAEVFVVSHYPEQTKWQLLEKPISHAEFFRRPVLGPQFFAHGLVLESPNQSQVSATNGVLELTMQNPRGTFITAEMEPKEGGARVKCTGDNVHKTCRFPGNGTYDVSLYVSDKQYGASYEYAASIEVNSRQ